MLPVTNNSTFLLEKTMQGLWTRQSAILDNIANAETPNYKAKYVTFEETLQARLRSARAGTTSSAMVRKAIEGADAKVRTADESTRMDDNGVNVTTQNIELVRTSYELQYTMQAIGANLSLMRSAIRGQ